MFCSRTENTESCSNYVKRSSDGLSTVASGNYDDSREENDEPYLRIRLGLLVSPHLRKSWL